MKHIKIIICLIPLLTCACSKDENQTPFFVDKIVSSYSEDIVSVDEFIYNQETVYLITFSYLESHVTDYAISRLLYNQSGYAIGSCYYTFGGKAWTTGCDEFESQSIHVRTIWDNINGWH